MYLLCPTCTMGTFATPGEHQCPQCGHWWVVWTTTHGRLACARVWDRERTDEQMTAQEQAAIVRATRFLEERGKRMMIDFGWRNAVALATTSHDKE